MSKTLKDKIADLINRERTRLEKERDFYRQKLRETMEWYGCGGPYARQEAAMEKREEELEALDDFAYQLRHAEEHFTANVYFFGCRNCGAVTITTRSPFSDWHECPACRQMVNLRNVPSTEIRLVNDGAWTKMLRQAKEEGNGEI